MSVDNAIEEFIGDVKRILADDGPGDAGRERIRQRMAELTRNPAAVEAADAEAPGNIHTGRQSHPLYQGESGLTLVRARFGPEAMTPIHNHGSWGVVGVYRGRDRYQVWRRVDGGAGPGEAHVEMVEERILEPGEAIVLPHPPQDIHAQQGHDGEPTYEFVLFGSGAAMTQPRLYFDPERHHAEEVMPGRR
jgi:predicted metal-dependent enzyme (double-stranded beta helix superfamily)